MTGPQEYNEKNIWKFNKNVILKNIFHSAKIYSIPVWPKPNARDRWLDKSREGTDLFVKEWADR